MRRWFLMHPQAKTLSPAAESFRYFILEHGERFLATQSGTLPDPDRLRRGSARRSTRRPLH